MKLTFGDPDLIEKIKAEQEEAELIVCPACGYCLGDRKLWTEDEK